MPEQKEQPTFAVGDRIRFRNTGQKATVRAIYHFSYTEHGREHPHDTVLVEFDRQPFDATPKTLYTYSAEALVRLADKRVDGPTLK